MGLPVVTVASGGLPVSDGTAGGKPGVAVTEATNGCGVAVTKVAGGAPVVYVPEAGGGGGGGTGGWTPASLTTVRLWLKGDTLTGTTGDAIATWSDVSGGGNNATQATSGNRPTLQTAHQNGLNVVRFNAANSNHFALPNAFQAFTQGAIAFVARLVVDPGTAGSKDHGPFHIGGDGAGQQNHYPYGGDQNIYDDFGSIARWGAGNAPPLDVYHVGGFRAKAGQWQYVYNGGFYLYNIPSGNTVAWTTTPFIGRTFGVSDYFDGYIGEVVLLNEFASTSDWQKLEGYLAWKWGLQGSLDSGHPYKSAPPAAGSGGGTTYATWDPATVTAVTLSGGNLVATNTGTTSADQGAKVATASGKTSGKYYFEIAYTTLTSAGGNTGVGVGTAASTYTGMGSGATTGVMFYRGGSIYANGGLAANTGIPNFIAGDVVGIAIDLDNRKAWFRKNPSGNWNGNATYNPATNVGGITIPIGAMVPFGVFGGGGGTAGNVFTANFGASAFAGAVPSGFTSGWPA